MMDKSNTKVLISQCFQFFVSLRRISLSNENSIQEKFFGLPHCSSFYPSKIMLNYFIYNVYKGLKPVKSFNSAFTLAEILITLGIIGVVASITIPAVINTTQDSEYRSALKKSLSTLSQAYAMVKSNNGGSIKGMCTDNDSTCFANLFKTTLKINSEVSGVPNTTNLPNCWNNNDISDPPEPHICWVLNDGSVADFDMEYSDCSVSCAVINVDVNGLKGPNKWGKDRYSFSVYDDNIKAFIGPCNNGTGTGAYGTNAGCAYKYLYQ